VTADSLTLAIQNPSRYPEAAEARLAPWLGALLAEVAPDRDSFHLRLAGDRALRELNRRFRGKDKATDVLCLPGEPTPEGKHLGDVVISVATARRQAREAGHPAARELRILALHGVLHCLGHDHETDQGEMARLEGRLRKRWLDRD
jgi:probable rRNA maturation factor